MRASRRSSVCMIVFLLLQFTGWARPLAAAPPGKAPSKTDSDNLWKVQLSHHKGELLVVTPRGKFVFARVQPVYGFKHEFVAQVNGPKSRGASGKITCIPTRDPKLSHRTVCTYTQKDGMYCTYRGETFQITRDCAYVVIGGKQFPLDGPKRTLVFGDDGTGKLADFHLQGTLVNDGRNYGFSSLSFAKIKQPFAQKSPGQYESAESTEWTNEFTDSPVRFVHFWNIYRDDCTHRRLVMLSPHIGERGPITTDWLRSGGLTIMFTGLVKKEQTGIWERNGGPNAKRLKNGRWRFNSSAKKKLPRRTYRYTYKDGVGRFVILSKPKRQTVFEVRNGGKEIQWIEQEPAQVKKPSVKTNKPMPQKEEKTTLK